MNSAQSKLIVVVDDDETFLDFIQMLLESEGYRVIAHWHGEDAVEVISASHPDLVILDWWLVDMSGAELVRAIKADPRTAQVPLLVCSAAHYDVRTAEEEL